MGRLDPSTGKPHQLGTVVTPTDRPKSIRNRCVIKIFGGVFVLSYCYSEFPNRIGFFVEGLGHISFFLSLPSLLTEINECDGATCLNGGRCVDQMGKYTCNCTDDFMGQLCETGNTDYNS